MTRPYARERRETDAALHWIERDLVREQRRRDMRELVVAAALFFVLSLAVELILMLAAEAGLTP